MLPEDAGTVYRTSSGGQSWKLLTTLQTSMFAFHIFFADQNNGWFLTGDALWGTGDGGETWAPKFQVDNAQFGFVKDIFFMDKNTGWLATSKGFVITCGGG